MNISSVISRVYLIFIRHNELMREILKQVQNDAIC